MIPRTEAVEALAASINIVNHDEAERLVDTAGPLYRDGKITWPALTAACGLLYRGYDDFNPYSKAHLLREARGILRLAENTPATVTA